MTLRIKWVLLPILQDILTPAELQVLLASPHPPMLALQVRRWQRLLRMHALQGRPAHHTLHPITCPAASMPSHLH
jgi:hypothetical protein